jgi:hypothetical protein
MVHAEMNNNTTWFEVFVTLGAGMVLLVIAAGLLALTNPRLEAKCQAAGGQVLARPGNVSSCLYPAK